MHGLAIRVTINQRIRRICVLVCLVFLSVGCQPLQFNRVKLEPTPVVFQDTPAQNDLMQLVNQRSQSVKELQAQVSVSMTGIPTRLNGNLTIQRPRNLRLKISPLGMDSIGADVGSNAEQFWVWIKSAGVGGDSMLLHARHDEFARSPNANQLPLDPQWLFDSLGLVTFDPGKSYHGPSVQDGRLVIRETEMRPAGPQTSQLIFDPKTGVLLQKALYGAQGQRIGYCTLSQHEYIPAVGAAVPTHVKICLNAGAGNESTVEIQLSNIQINGLYVDPASAWQMPNPIGVRKVDLARTVLQPSQMMVQPVNYEETQPVSSSQFNDYLPFRGALLNKFSGR